MLSFSEEEQCDSLGKDEWLFGWSGVLKTLILQLIRLPALEAIEIDS